MCIFVCVYVCIHSYTLIPSWIISFNMSIFAGCMESNSEWEDDASSINTDCKDKTMNSLKDLLQSIRDLQFSNIID